MKTKAQNLGDYLQTNDLSLCATLRYFGYQVESIDRQNPNKAVFVFKKDGQIDTLIQQYWAHQLQVEPLGFFNFLKEIKTRIYS